jgi:lysine biosynthesis protein LysW
MDNNKKVECPDCGSHVSLQGPLEIGNTTVCPGCDALLKIIELDPVHVEAESVESYDEEEVL